LVKESETRVLQIIRERGGWVRSGDLRKLGIHPTLLPELQRQGALLCVKRGLYVLPGASFADERRHALMALPGSVLCLGSALSFHEIGSWEPPEIQLAVPAGRKIRVPETMPIRLFHFTKGSFDLGLGTIDQGGFQLRVYDAERSLCDLFRLRHLIGGDIAFETLRSFVKRSSRSIPRLLEYARVLNIYGPLTRALEALV
jgi:predicted transcriptional regulator of viral defense system